MIFVSIQMTLLVLVHHRLRLVVLETLYLVMDHPHRLVFSLLEYARETVTLIQIAQAALSVCNGIAMQAQFQDAMEETMVQLTIASRLQQVLHLAQRHHRLPLPVIRTLNSKCTGKKATTGRKKGLSESGACDAGVDLAAVVKSSILRNVAKVTFRDLTLTM